MKELLYSEYVNLFMQFVPKAKKVDNTTCLGRCVICGDSKKDIHKTRLYLLKNNNSKPNVIKCHNCGYSASANNFFMTIAPDEMKKRCKTWAERDLKDLKKLGTNTYLAPEVDVQSFNPDDYLRDFEKELPRAKTAVCNFFKNHTYSILKNDLALEYIRGRMVPEYYIKKMLLLKPEYHDFSVFQYAYFRDYIIIPFIDFDDGLPYYFHSRKYLNHHTRMSRYLMCPYRPETEVDFIFNEQYVSRDLPILVAEGTLDACNLPNALSSNGIHKITEDFIQRIEYRYGTNIIYVLDNQNVDKDAKNKTIELLKNNKQVFLWSSLIKDVPSVQNIHDINELCCAAGKYEIPLDTILKYTRNNVSALL